MTGSELRREPWPLNVARVAAFLEGAHAEARLEELAADGATAAEAAEVIGCGIAAIAKSMVLMCDGSAAVAVVPGDRRVDTAKVARLCDVRRVTVASPDDVAAATGFLPGSVSPFGLAESLVVLVDRRFLEYPVVWASGGSPRHMVAVAPRELARLAHARIEDLSRE